MSDSNVQRDFMQWLPIAILLLAMPTTPVSAESTPSTPEQMVHAVTMQFTKRLARDAERLKADPESVKAIVSELVLPHVDFPTLAPAAFGTYWDQLSLGEQRCATIGFRERLLEHYARTLLHYEYKNIVTNPLPEISRDAPIFVTQTAMTPHPQPLSIKYKLEFIDDDWKVVDLIVANVSLVNSYRVTFAEEIAAQGLGDFLRTIPACRER